MRLLTHANIHEVVDCPGREVAIFGDVILDRGCYSDAVDRISPEAPVLIFPVEYCITALGGAAGIGVSVASLGGVPAVTGVLGDDFLGHEALHMMRLHGLAVDRLLVINEYVTSEVKRLIAGNHLARGNRQLDLWNKEKESVRFDAETMAYLRERALSCVESYDHIVLFEDPFGVLAREVRQAVVQAACAQGKSLWTCSAL